MGRFAPGAARTLRMLAERTEEKGSDDRNHQQQIPQEQKALRNPPRVLAVSQFTVDFVLLYDARMAAKVDAYVYDECALKGEHR